MKHNPLVLATFESFCFCRYICIRAAKGGREHHGGKPRARTDLRPSRGETAKGETPVKGETPAKGETHKREKLA